MQNAPKTDAGKRRRTGQKKHRCWTPKGQPKNRTPSLHCDPILAARTVPKSSGQNVSPDSARSVARCKRKHPRKLAPASGAECQTGHRRRARKKKPRNRTPSFHCGPISGTKTVPKNAGQKVSPDSSETQIARCFWEPKWFQERGLIIQLQQDEPTVTWGAGNAA